MRGNWRIVASEDFVDQVLHAVGIKGVLQGEHFIQNATHTPDVTLLVVRFLLANLRRQVVRGANGSLSAVVSVLEQSGNSKVPNLHISLLCQEYILSFQVSVENLFVVNMLDAHANLDEPVKHLVL